MNNYIKRKIEDDILEASQKTPVVALTGPRQSGKTTLTKHLFPDYTYVNLEFPDIRLYAEKDPRGFLSQSKHMVIDEIQRVPNLFSYIQGMVDQDKDLRYILTGSNNFSLLHNISQSLAGRVALFTLLPFSIGEIRTAGINIHDMENSIFNGWYPRVLADHNDPKDWYQNYIQTYLEKDVRDMNSIHMIDRFYTFLKVIALRTGSILNYAELSKEVGVSANTIKDWVSVLEASYIIYKLQPYHANIKKRLVKSPRLYFYDTGLLCSLAGILNPEQLLSYPHKGFLFENFIISEYIKTKQMEREARGFSFYRDHDGNEVDLVIENGEDVDLLEIKMSKSFSGGFLSAMERFDAEVKSARKHILVYGGEISQMIDGVDLISWKDILK